MHANTATLLRQSLVDDAEFGDMRSRTEFAIPSQHSQMEGNQPDRQAARVTA